MKPALLIQVVEEPRVSVSPPEIHVTDLEIAPN
jgi:hypothetical protein